MLQNILYAMAIGMAMACASAPAEQAPIRPNLAIGTYTDAGSHGIYLAHFDTATGDLRLLDSIAAVNPSYLAWHPEQQGLYAVLENGGDQPGQVVGWRQDPSTGGWGLLSQRPSGGDHPCYVSVSPNGRILAVANYSGGSVALYRLDERGRFGEATWLHRRVGKGPNAARQEKPHVHTAVWDPASGRLVIADLGTDQVVAYRIDSASLQPLDSLVLTMPPGAGPRHLAFHPTLPRWYVVQELTGSVSVWDMSRPDQPAMLQQLQTDTISQKPGSADIHLSADGAFAYISNRIDANNITVLRIGADGLLTTLQHQPVLGLTPRNFLIWPTGKFLLSANQNSGEVVVFQRNTQTGMLSAAGKTQSISKPVCLIPLP